MSITKKMLSMFAFAAISLSACSDNSTSATTADKKLEIVASPLTITGKLQTKTIETGSDQWKLVPWTEGAGKIVASLSVSDYIAEAEVSADGSFTITLPGTLKSPHVIEYVNLGGGYTANPARFLTISSTIESFYFFPKDNPETPNINESQYYEMISPVLVNETDLSVIQRFGYIMTENATLKGTSTNGQVKQNSTYKKGWNIDTWIEVNGVSEHSVIETLPAKVVWY